MIPTVERLNELFLINPDGQLIRKIKAGSQAAGKLAGSLADGRVTVDNYNYNIADIVCRIKTGHSDFSGYRNYGHYKNQNIVKPDPFGRIA